MRLLLSVPTALIVLTGAVGATEQEQRLACSVDAFKLCIAYIPDREQVAQCMISRRADLSPPCQKVVDAGLAARRNVR